MSTIVHLPNGSKVTVATDDPQAAAKAAKAYWSQLGEEERNAPPPDDTAPRKPRTALQTAGDFLGDTIDNVLPNWGDEVAAIPDAAKALVNGEDVGEAFDKGRHEFKANQAQYDEEHPWLAWGSTLTGLGASLALPAGRLASGAGMAAKVAHGAAVGAGYGAVAGAGEGDSMADRAGNATSGALVGGVTGAAMLPVLNAARGAARFIERTVPGAAAVGRGLRNVPRAVMRRPLLTRAQQAQERANQFLSSRLNQGNVSTGFGRQGPAASLEALEAEVWRRRQLGVPAMLGDVTDTMRATTSWASRGDGPGQTLVRNALQRRKSDEAMRVRQHITDNLGDAVDPLAQMRAHEARASAEARPLYAEAYSQPVVVTDAIRELHATPAFRKALPQAFENIQNAQRNPIEMGFHVMPDGTVATGPSLTTEAYDHIARAMQASGRAAGEHNPLTGAVRDTTNSVHINRRAADLSNELSAQNGAYRDVKRMYADELGMRDALAAGQAMPRQTGSEVRAVTQGLQGNARNSWAIGARSALADAASEWGSAHPTGSTAAHVRQRLGDANKQEALEGLMGQDANVPRLRDALEAEHQGNITWGEVHGNSKTAMRQQADADLDAATGASRPSSWTVRSLAGRAFDAAADRTTRRSQNAMKEHVGRVLTETNPDRLASFMSDIADLAAQEEATRGTMQRTAVVGAKMAGRSVQADEPGMFSADGQRWHRGADGMMYNDDETFGYDPGALR